MRLGLRLGLRGGFAGGSSGPVDNPITGAIVSSVTVGVAFVIGNLVTVSATPTVTVAATLTATDTPKLVSGLLAWYRADLGVTGTTAISAWADQSGTGDSNKNAAQSTAGNRPSLNSSDSGYNNCATISFSDTGPQYLVTGTWSSAPSQPTTIFVVGQRGTNAGGATMVDGIGASNRNIIYSESVGGNYAIYAGTQQTDSAFPTNTKVALCAIYNGASSKLYVNSITTASISANAGAQTLTGLTLGDNYTAGANLNGKLAEVIVYSGSLSQADRTTVMNYLASRYSITLS